MSDVKAAQITSGLLDELFGADGQTVGVRLWDGSLWPDPAPRPVTILLQHPGALREMLLPGTELGMGEAYIYDDIDLVGNVELVFGLAERLTESIGSPRAKLRLARDLLRLPAGQGQLHSGRRGPAQLSGDRHSVERDRQAVRYHYDVSGSFYQLWLDQRMVYSCAYFASEEDSLDVAQEHKLDYICRKMRLKPGQRILDIGCGWGGLVIYAAQHYGVDATGITLSQPQADLANERIASAGLADRCRVQVRDYREVQAPEGYDALVSVGMFEHVGEALLGAYFRRAWELLRPAGVFLNHGIATCTASKPTSGKSFQDAYVFPDGELVPINVTLRAAEGAGLEVRDVESLREHYALTLRHWVRRLEAQHEVALRFVDEPTYRVWRLYMSSSAYGFAMGKISVYQTLLVKSDSAGRSDLPLRREDWYKPQA
jgi:cyclopropane-fatty-acyl-phospholipid synthase